MLYQRVQAAIDSRGLKQRFVAEKLGVKDATLSDMLSGKRRITAEEFLAICNLLGVSPNELYGYKEVTPHDGQAAR